MEPTVDYFYNDAVRWSFGFDNPNKAAVIFACLAPIAWTLWLLSWRIKTRLVRLLSLLLASGLIMADSFLLFKTYSRGGVVAALGAGLYLFWKSTSWNKQSFQLCRLNRVVSALLLLMMLVALFIWTGLGNRVTDPVTAGDASVSHRIVLWRAALEMAADNPVGFGTGHSGSIYMQWYEPVEMSARYRTMVSSYLTFLVEQGWLPSVFLLMVSVWFWIWTNPLKGTAKSYVVVVALRATLMAFSISGIFSTVMEEPLLWIIPGASALALIFWCLVLRFRPSRQSLITALGVALTTSSLFYLGGIAQGHFDAMTRKVGLLHGARNVVELTLKHSPAAQTWIVIPDERILGENPGRLLRQLALKADVHLQIQDQLSSVTAKSCLFLIGHGVEMAPISSYSSVVLLYPNVIPVNQAYQWLKSCHDSLVFLPGIDEDGRAAFWQSCADSTKVNPPSTKKLEGVGLRIDWAWSDVIRSVKELNHNISKRTHSGGTGAAAGITAGTMVIRYGPICALKAAGN